MNFKQILFGGLGIYALSKIFDEEKMNGPELSGYKIGWIHLIPIKGYVTKRDILELKRIGLPVYPNMFKSKYFHFHFSMDEKNQIIKKLKSACLHKNYYVIFYTDKQFGMFEKDMDFSDINRIKKFLTTKQKNEIFKIKKCEKLNSPIYLKTGKLYPIDEEMASDIYNEYPNQEYIEDGEESLIGGYAEIFRDEDGFGLRIYDKLKADVMVDDLKIPTSWEFEDDFLKKVANKIKDQYEEKFKEAIRKKMDWTGPVGIFYDLNKDKIFVKMLSNGEHYRDKNVIKLRHIKFDPTEDVDLIKEGYISDDELKKLEPKIKKWLEKQGLDPDNWDWRNFVMDYLEEKKPNYLESLYEEFNWWIEENENKTSGKGGWDVDEWEEFLKETLME